MISVWISAVRSVEGMDDTRCLIMPYFRVKMIKPDTFTALLVLNICTAAILVTALV
jgi:hypothetical protein